MLRFISRAVVLAACLAGLLQPASGQPSLKSPKGFTHPGLLYSKEDLDRIRKVANSGRQPWAQGYEALKSAPQSSLDYAMQGPFKNVGYENGQYEFRRDASAAYNLALMWISSGDGRYAAKSIDIIRSWAREMATFDQGDHLTGGMGVHKFAIAAEIFRYTPGSGWTEEDTGYFTTFLNRLRPSVDKPDLFMNQGGYAMMGMVAIAVFTDDLELYQKTIHRATAGDHKDPRKDPSISRTITASGQVMEMGRDQTHPQGGLGSLACIARTAWVQGEELTGVDLFGYLDNRLLKGFEYLAAHNLGYELEYKGQDDQGNPALYRSFSATDRGKLSPIFEMVYHHYRDIQKVSPEALRHCAEVRRYLMPEGFSEDFPGFGTLTFSLSEDSDESTKIQQVPKQSPPKEPEGRFRAANFSATQGVGREYHAASSGQPDLVASNIQEGNYTRYDGFDFGPSPVDTLIVSAGSASPADCKIDVLLDRLDAEPIGTLQVANTGWWSTFETFSANLRQPVTGKHTLFLKFYGANHVYKFQCNLHWFRFGNKGTVAVEEAAAAARVSFPFMAASGYGAVLSGLVTIPASGDASEIEIIPGTTLVFPAVEFSSGARHIAVTLSKSNGGKITLRVGDSKSEPMAMIELPPNDTGSFSAPVINQKLKGSQMVFLTYAGDVPLRFGGFQLDPPAY